MLTMRLPYWITLPWIPRNGIKIIAGMIFLSGLFLAAANYLAKDVVEPKELKIAALALVEDMQNTPPRQNGWIVTRIGVSAAPRLEMDVEVAYEFQANFIKSRTGRVRHSYLKLACPLSDAKVYTVLGKQDTIWLRLHYNNELLASGICPKSSSPFN